MRICFKATDTLVSAIRTDLARPHLFAAERVGFISCRVGALEPTGLIILAHKYHPVDDGDYVDDATVGAMMGPTAIRKALEFAYNNDVAMFHVHIHDHRGIPAFSYIDRRETAKFVPDFWKVRPSMPHGALVLSQDSACGLCWYPKVQKPFAVTDFSFVGSTIVQIRTTWTND